MGGSKEGGKRVRSSRKRWTDRERKKEGKERKIGGKYQVEVKSDGGEKEGRDRPGKDEAIPAVLNYIKKGGMRQGRE